MSAASFARAEQRVLRLVNAHRLAKCPAHIRGRIRTSQRVSNFDQRQTVGRVAIDLVCRGENEGRFGTILAGGFEQIKRAVGVDAEIRCGSRAAQSCDGWAAVWITAEIARPFRLNTNSSSSGSRTSPSMCWYFVTSACNRSRLHAVLASSPNRTRRISLSMPTTSKPSAAKNLTVSAPISPAEPVTNTTLICCSRGRSC